MKSAVKELLVAMVVVLHRKLVCHEALSLNIYWECKPYNYHQPRIPNSEWIAVVSTTWARQSILNNRDFTCKWMIVDDVDLALTLVRFPDAFSELQVQVSKSGHTIRAIQ